MAIAVFDYSLWAARFPELATNVAQPLATALFNEAGIYLDNSDASPVSDAAKRLVLLNLLVAHLASMSVSAAAGNAFVGRIKGAKQGSVSVDLADYHLPGSGQWYAQTPYGAQYWAMTAAYRTMRYVPGSDPSRSLRGVPGWRR